MNKKNTSGTTVVVNASAPAGKSTTPMTKKKVSPKTKCKGKKLQQKNKQKGKPVSQDKRLVDALVMHKANPTSTINMDAFLFLSEYITLRAVLNNPRAFSTNGDMKPSHFRMYLHWAALSFWRDMGMLTGDGVSSFPSFPSSFLIPAPLGVYLAYTAPYKHKSGSRLMLQLDYATYASILNCFSSTIGYNTNPVGFPYDCTIPTFYTVGRHVYNPPESTNYGGENTIGFFATQDAVNIASFSGTNAWHYNNGMTQIFGEATMAFDQVPKTAPDASFYCFTSSTADGFIYCPVNDFDPELARINLIQLNATNISFYPFAAIIPTSKYAYGAGNVVVPYTRSQVAVTELVFLTMNQVWKHDGKLKQVRFLKKYWGEKLKSMCIAGKAYDCRGISQLLANSLDAMDTQRALTPIQVAAWNVLLKSALVNAFTTCMPYYPANYVISNVDNAGPTQRWGQSSVDRVRFPIAVADELSNIAPVVLSGRLICPYPVSDFVSSKRWYDDFTTSTTLVNFVSGPDVSMVGLATAAVIPAVPIIRGLNMDATWRTNLNARITNSYISGNFRYSATFTPFAMVSRLAELVNPSTSSLDYVNSFTSFATPNFGSEKLLAWTTLTTNEGVREFSNNALFIKYGSINVAEMGSPIQLSQAVLGSILTCPVSLDDNNVVDTATYSLSVPDTGFVGTPAFNYAQATMAPGAIRDRPARQSIQVGGHTIGVAPESEGWLKGELSQKLTDISRATFSSAFEAVSDVVSDFATNAAYHATTYASNLAIGAGATAAAGLLGHRVVQARPRATILPM